jgi:two-component system sensor histidine kinase/response regulator
LNFSEEVIHCLLVKEGALVTPAENGQQAVDLLSANPHAFDLVLIDMQMPVLDGCAATRVIRQDLGISKLPIVAMTANAMDSDRVACLEAGMNDHVGKPFQVDSLVEVLVRHSLP